MVTHDTIAVRPPIVSPGTPWSLFASHVPAGPEEELVVVALQLRTACPVCFSSLKDSNMNDEFLWFGKKKVLFRPKATARLTSRRSHKL